MKQFKQLLSLVLSVALALSLVLIPQGGVTQASAVGEQTGSGSTIHPFSGTDALIRDTIEELQALGKTAEATTEDKALAARVERASGLSYAEVRSALYGALTADFSASQIDVSALGLSEQLLSQVLESVLRDNYMSGAFTGLTYTTENGKVTRVGYTVSEGYAAAMGAYSTEVMDVDMSDLAVDAPEAVQEEAAQSSAFGGSKGYATYDNEEGGEDGDGEETATCTNHTVGGSNVGDYNLDGEINVGDVAKFRSMVLSEDESCRDFNEDGEINVGDVAKFRNMVLSEELVVGDPEVTFTWNEEPVKDQTPITDEDGNTLNGGLLYEDGEVSQGILPNVYYELESITFTCAECGEEITWSGDELAEHNVTVSPQDVWVNMMTGESFTVDAGEDPGLTEEELEYHILYTEIELAIFMDDSFSVTPVFDDNGDMIMGEDGNPVVQPVTDEEGNIIGMFNDSRDNGAAEVSYYYSVLSSFINDKADYFGTPTDFWTSKNTENNPMAALKYVCNVDPETQVPPAQMTMMVRDLPQAFMAYYYQYGNELVAMRNAAIKAMPEGLTDVQQQLFLHDWLAENAWFDMGAMTAKDENGNPASSDPIQMTTFGALLSNQLRDSYDANGDGEAEGYYGALCPGYAAAYNLLVQAANPDVYQTTETNEDGEEITRWATVAEVDARGGDLVDFVQVLFYTNTAETSIAGEGFGGGWFNNVHYFSAVKLESPDPTSEGVDDDGNAWYYVDACYDDIYIECLQQYRGESDGSVNHTYFLLSPQTCADLYGDNVERIDSLYDGYVYTETDEVYEEGDDKYNPDDPDHHKYSKDEVDTEFKYDDTSYEDSWFSSAISKVYWDDDYFYYVDGGASAASYADMMGQMESEDSDSDMADSVNMSDMMHGSRVGVDEQDLLKRRSRDPEKAPDYWVDEEEDDSETSMFSSKEDPYAEVLFDYGTGEMNGEVVLADEVIEDFVFNEQYPALTHTVALYGDQLYFNLSNDIYVCGKDGSNVKLFKEYNDVSATSDGRVFTATSYTLDENGELKLEYPHPIGAICVRTAYEPQYGTYTAEDGKEYPYFAEMKPVEMLTVNIATNHSFTSDGTGEDADRYSVEAVNFNPDYQLYGEKQEGENDNAEFMWCAVIRDEIEIADMVTSGGSTVNVPATCTRPAYTDTRTSSGVITNREVVEGSAPTGHNYVYNETEGVYLCETCKLHATVQLEPTENGAATLYSVSSNGLEGLQGMEGYEDVDFDQEVIPVSTFREAESKITGEIEIICQPDEGYRVATVKYKYEGDTDYTPISATVVADEETGEDKYQYILDKEEGCVSIQVTFEEDVYTVTVNPVTGGEVLASAEDATASSDGTLIVPTGAEVTLTVEPDDGYEGKAPTVTYTPVFPEEGQTTDTPVELVLGEDLIANEDGTYSFKMPEGDVTVTGQFEVEAYEITLSYERCAVAVSVGEGEDAHNLTDGEKVQPGTVVTVTVENVEGYTAGEPVVKTDGEDSKDVTVTPVEGKDGVYTFVMPDANVTITVDGTPIEETKVYNVKLGEYDTDAGTVVVDTGVLDGAAEAGATVKITITPSDGYTANEPVVTDSNGDPVAVKLVEGETNVYTFTMPASDVTVTVTFKAKEVTPPEQFDITPVIDAEEGTVTFTVNGEEVTTAAAGDIVTVTAEPKVATQMEVESIVVSYGETTIPLKSGETFEMPASDVTVTVTFKEIGTGGSDNSET